MMVRTMTINYRYPDHYHQENEMTHASKQQDVNGKECNIQFVGKKDI